MDIRSDFFGGFMGKYSEQFKRSAVQAYLDGPTGYRTVAKEVGMDCSQLRRWVADYRLRGDAIFQKLPKRDYSEQFKQSVVQHMLANSLSYRETAAVFGLGQSSQVGKWNEQYYSGGLEALASHKKGNCGVMPKPPRKALDQVPVTDDSKTREQLLAELDYLRMEVDYLKKLRALREEKERAAAAKKRK